ncbi:MAG: DNA-formamidopyrimidine glycosylase [Desulfitobacteriaceae bacterium]|nr:DNA-formamidopyrimidine glycosylase [Desulfitobacteriaceae bacterium]MDD4345708.1 DNA-formamidopyrimidine glycosylase [Desulfitobacteriaceae bacterium]MDD4401358.1 DNA-formamidopyrimidine glycosylase [Desulfitobacteriaceae bacterium]
MPELPEVETIRRTLLERVLGLNIIEVKVLWPPVAQNWQDRIFAEVVCGRKIESIERRGKYLLFTLDEGWSLVAHLRMTGRLNYYSCVQVPERHTHLVFSLNQGELHFSDVRKFGRIQLIPTDLRFRLASLAKLGPEPLDADFTANTLGKRLASKKTNLKTALLDQRVLAGLGNIYVDEALFRSGLAPERKVCSLSADEIGKLYGAIREVLQASILAHGTSLRDYRDANGRAGNFQDLLQVYGRGAQPCLKCGRLLEKIRLAGRTTVFCKSCQS